MTFYPDCTECLFDIILHVSCEKIPHPKVNKINFPTKHKNENKSRIKSKIGVTGAYFSPSASIFDFHYRPIDDPYAHSSLYF